MKAMIFAAGLGTRLKPFTDTMPKALVPVNGTPMLEHVITHLIKQGFDDIVVNVYHFGKKIVDFLETKNNFGINIHISDERDCLLDTGGGILKARQWLDGNEPILIHNADILTDLDLREMRQQHIESGADATILVANRNTARYFLFDNDNNLKGWTNISTGEIKPKTLTEISQLTQLAFGGVHIISPSIFNTLEHYSSEPKFSITPFYIDSCNSLKIKGYQPKDAYQWFDIGKPETLTLAENSFKIQ